jgi:hypothetical protein
MKRFEAERVKYHQMRLHSEESEGNHGFRDRSILCRTGQREKETASSNRFPRMELAVHPPLKTILPRTESTDRNKIERRLREIQARRSEANDPFEVAVQEYIATDRGGNNRFVN